MTYTVHKRFKGKGIGGDFNLPYGTKCRMEDGLIYAPDGRCVCVATSENGWEHFHEDSVVGNERHRMLQWLYKYYSSGEHGEDFAEDKWPGVTNFYWKNLLRTMPTGKLTEYYNERRASCSITTSSYTRSSTTI